ncbi:hypothetical protein ABW20_dc0104555 [Dactylellina cionopaga]|nr:hypothetical protein ABW20_dc0104555 [Dactylellina cionopaga]
MDFSAPTRPIPSTSSLFSNSTAVKPPTTPNANLGQHSLQPQAASSASASSSTSLKRASTEPADGINASSSNTMPSLRSRSNKVAKNSQNGAEQATMSAQLQNGDAKAASPPTPLYDPKDDIRGMIDTFVIRAELQSPHDEGLALRQQQAEALKMVETDKGDSKGLFTGMFTKKLSPIYDPEDRVARCPDCTWEIEDRRCPNCGRRFHASELPGGDSDVSDASDSSDDDSELDEEEEDDESLSGSDRSGMGMDDDDMHDLTDYGESDIGPWEPDYDEDHRLALALQDQYHQEFMRHLGVTPNWVEEHFGADRALAAREAARDSLQRSMSRNYSSPGRSLQHSSPYSRDSEDDSEENTLDEEDSELDDFIVHDTPDRRHRRRQPTGRTLRHARRSVADLSDDEEEDEDEDEDEEPVVGGRNNRPNRYYDRRAIVISSDNEDDEEALINDGYSQLDHDTTTGDDDDGDDSLGESDIGQILRPSGPLRASTMPLPTVSMSVRRGLREQAAAAQQQAAAEQRSVTPPGTRRRRRTVTFQVPEDADGEDDSDAKDDDGDLDMDRHSRAGSTSLASITSNRTDASTRANRSGGNHFSRDTPSVNEDESSDDSLPRQRSGRRRIGNTTSSSNLRRAATAHPTGSRNRVNRATNSVDPVVHQLLRNFSAQRNESQLEQLGRSVDAPAGGVAAVPAPRSASHDLQELNEPIIIASSPAPTFFPASNNSRQASAGPGSTRGSSVFSGLSSPPPQSTTTREASVLSTDSTTPTPNLLSMQGPRIRPNVTNEHTSWEVPAATTSASVTSSHTAASGANQNGSTNRGSMRTRRSNAALRNQGPQRSGTPTGRMPLRANRSQPPTPAEREEIERRARVLLAGQMSRDITSGRNTAQPSATTTNTRSSRSTQAPQGAMPLQHRITHRAEGSSTGRDSVTPTPPTQNQDGANDNAPPRGIARTDSGGSAGRRRAYPIMPVNNPASLFVISDDDGH